MKRDWDTVRLILTKLEELPDSLSTLELFDFYFDEGVNPDDDFYDIDNRISYHMALLIEDGLVVGSMDDHVSINARNFKVVRLTSAGHDFLDSIRQDTVWKKTKETLISKGVDMTYETIKQVAIATVTSMLGLST
ncbi:DUF2513 domain-containing protein [Aeromonas veronii]|uniref:DUF2513 domain-containing protein n=1 Tax=Aeromonas veronii TaxID=654 RepID=UPI0019345D4A|nr:DUF2513 domain-containing protein [Aeromonas veronii]MBM0419843.1 DUF2513 domain-containing protein [Aeromonas veronii]MBW3790345.1 DUF2513 domain-containing protein [Aeromonas veronii]